MNAIAIEINLTSLSMLVPTGTDTYQVVVQLFKLDDTPLDQSGISNQTTITFVTTTNRFIINYPVTEGVYNITGKAKIFLNNINSSCIAIENFSIFNTSSTTTTQSSTTTTTQQVSSSGNLTVYFADI